jgi:hypothetical protein
VTVGEGTIASAKLWLGAAMTLAFVQADAMTEYADARGRFRFAYPTTFGIASPGTNDGFGDRVAAIRFSVFSAGLGGEAVLTRGFPLIDLQAVGWPYDSIVLEIFPDAIRSLVVGTLTPLSSDNFCQQLVREQHIDPTDTALAALTPQQRAAVAATDQMRRVSPRVVRCASDGDTVTFDEEVAFQPGSPRQRVYGAVRFLDGAYSTFQMVRAGAAPDSRVLEQMTAVVNSWTPGW